jgi:hypothetical protein
MPLNCCVCAPNPCQKYVSLRIINHTHLKMLPNLPSKCQMPSGCNHYLAISPLTHTCDQNAYIRSISSHFPYLFPIKQNSRKEKLQKPISKHRQPPRHAAAYDDTALRIFSVEASLIRLFLKIIEGVGYHHCV